ncbi:MAG TPA: Ldh family oxidoreductase [Thermotogota bacterium]|nr:Ldh family oxidoreductase [Thermotogota bacterium]
MIDDHVVWWPFEDAQAFAEAAFSAAGVPGPDARICSEVLLEADKRGIDSHGIGRLKPIYIDRIREGTLQTITKTDIVRESPATAVVDGNNGMGFVVAKASMELAIEKAAKYGIGMVATRRSNHYGIAGYYPLMAIQKGMIGITGTNARPSIAPTFGVENMLGTNPLTWGMPTDEAFPFVLDCATSIAQRGKIEVYDRAGKEIPEGWVIGSDGGIRTDTHQILQDLVSGEAALLPLGGAGEAQAGYKGYGYATVVEILSAALQNGNFLKLLSGFDESGNKQPFGVGHFFIAINVESFIDLSTFKRITGTILRQLRASKKAAGAERIYTAGEKEHLAWLERKDKGVPMNAVLQKQMSWLKETYGLSDFSFPWEKD